MSGGARLAVGVGLVAFSLAASAATPARKGAAASAPPPTANARAASAPAAAASAPTEFNGALVAGVTYVADVFFDTRVLHIWRPVKEVVPGKDVAWTIAWTNLDQFPALKTPASAGAAATDALSRRQDRHALGIAEAAVDGDVPLRDPRGRAASRRPRRRHADADRRRARDRRKSRR